MNRPLVAFTGLMVAGAAAVGVYVAAPRGGEEESVQQVATATPVATVISTPQETPKPTAGTQTSSPSAIPEDWLTYVDPVLDFSLRYPPDLVSKDLTPVSPGPTSDGLNERVIQFQSATDHRRSVSISISPNAGELSPERWALEFTGCVPETLEPATVAGTDAVFCTDEAGESPVGAYVFELIDGKVFFATSRMPGYGFGQEFDLMIASISP